MYVAILIAGFLGLVFVLDWGQLIKPDAYQPVADTLFFIFKVGALSAIIVVEVPAIRSKSATLFIRGKNGNEAV